MSKFQLPTSKAGEAFPTTIQAPVAVRFAGVPAGSPLARELYAALQGPISQFYQACAQNYALSLGTHARVQRELPHAQLSYINNHGSETVYVRVSRELQEHAVRQLKRPMPWDFAVVEIEVPDLVKTNAYFGAFLGGEITNLAGVAEDYGSSGGYTYGSPPILQFADFNQPIIDSISGVTKRITSLKVDLRPFRTATAISVDIHGYIKVFNDVVITSSTLMAYTTRLVTGTGGGGYPIIGGTYLHMISPYTQSDATTLFPELVGVPLEGAGSYIENSTFDATWNGSAWSPADPNTVMAQWPGTDTGYSTTEWLPGITKKIERTGASWWRSFTSNPSLLPQNAPPITSPVNDGFGYRTLSWDFHHYYSPTYSLSPSYITRDATLRSVFFRGDTMTSVTDQYGTGKEYAVWEDPKLYPARPKMVIDRHTVPMITMAIPGDTSVENKFGMPKLGTLTLLIQDGAIAWKPA